MQTKIAANAQAMKRWLGKAETTLGNHSDRLNAINIFPVADGADIVQGLSLIHI